VTDRAPEEVVRAALHRAGFDVDIRVLGNTDTAPAAAAAVGCELGAIVKSLVFLADGRPVLVLAPGDRQVADAKLAALLGVGRKKIRFADAGTALALTGFRVGGVPPVGHRTPMPVYIDTDFARYDTVWAAAGSANSVFPITPAELQRVTAGELADICRRADPAGGT
jgi:Cys-tRNA(Pro) deacylase